MGGTRIISLLTDFGYKDPFVGVMKAVIVSINPDVHFIDITHGISRQDVYEAAFTLLLSYKYFPRNTIHVCVVDPGVGTGRKAVLLRTRNYFFIGPDNGCLMPAARDDGLLEAYDVSASPFKKRAPGQTFHGRDLFAPVAAYLSLGVPPVVIGEPLDKDALMDIGLEKPVCSSDCCEATILYIDVFGNLMTNIGAEWLGDLKYGKKLSLVVGDRVVSAPYYPSYGYVEAGGLVAYINSWGYLEIGVNHGSARDRLGLERGARIRVCKP